MNQFQPKMREIQEKYANNQQKMNEELQLLYAEEGINPMSGCLWSLLPFPIIIALYSIIRQPLSRFMLLSSETIERVREIATGLGYVAEQTGGRSAFYEEIQLTQFINDHFASFSGIDGLFRMDYNFLGLDLTVQPQSVWRQFFTGGWPVIGLVLIPIISAALSFFQSKVAMAQNGQKADDPAARQARSMTYMMPLMSLWIGFTLPAALGVYWIGQSVFQIIQDVILNKYFSTRMEQEETEKERKKREERVAKMMAAREQQRQYQEQATKGKSKQNQKKQQEKKPSEKKGTSTSEAGRIGDRPYARGRAYSPDHYGE